MKIDPKLYAAAKQYLNSYEKPPSFDEIAGMCRALRADGFARATEDKHAAFVAGLYVAHADDMRADQGLPSSTRLVDPGDHATRSARGATANAGGAASQADPDVMPDMSTWDLRRTKAAALALGAYVGADLRRRLADALLAKLREFGADLLAENYEKIWDGPGGIDEPSADEAERAGAAHADEVDISHEAAKARLRAASAQEWRGRSRRTQADVASSAARSDDGGPQDDPEPAQPRVDYAGARGTGTIQDRERIALRDRSIAELGTPGKDRKRGHK